MTRPTKYPVAVLARATEVIMADQKGLERIQGPLTMKQWVEELRKKLNSFGPLED